MVCEGMESKGSCSVVGGVVVWVAVAGVGIWLSVVGSCDWMPCSVCVVGSLGSCGRATRRRTSIQ